jgi:diguanylate cyclase (GGDEF)-like protein
MKRLSHLNDIPCTVLKSIEIFSDLDEESLSLLFNQMTYRVFKEGEALFNEGDPGEELFCILSGAVSIQVQITDGKILTISEIESGNFFGEMSIIEHAPRSATCRTKQITECLSLHSDDFNSLIIHHPELAIKIMNRMLAITSGRLLNVGTFLSQMVQWGESSRKRAITDPATGLFNRRYMDDTFDNLIARAQNEGKSLTYVMFDMDRFGSINAAYGQDFGDKIIVQSAEVFKNTFREQDILIRYGGDEFIFIFPDTDKDTAQTLCNALCTAVRNMTFPEHPDLRLSCSMGFACFPHHAIKSEELREKADKALYQAKEQGRDRALSF